MPYRGWIRGVRPGVRVAEEGLGVSDRPAPTGKTGLYAGYTSSDS